MLISNLLKEPHIEVILSQKIRLLALYYYNLNLYTKRFYILRLVMRLIKTAYRLQETINFKYH